jgi:hypothetical protein
LVLNIATPAATTNFMIVGALVTALALYEVSTASRTTSE